MAIAKLNPDAAPPIMVTTPETIKAPTNSIFTALVPEASVASLLKYVEGYPWTVIFYGQLLNINNTVEHFDPSSPNLIQPYYRIVDLIVQVNSPLSSSYSTETGITTITGSAIMPLGTKPNVGDLFLAQVDTGEDAIFHITSVTRKTHRKQSLYEVAYSLHTYVSDSPGLLPTIEARVNDTYFFNKDTNYFNRDVLIKPSVKEARDRLQAFLHESVSYYLKTFVQPKTGSLLIPGHPDTLYDPLLVNFISKTVDYSKLTDGRYFRPTFQSNEIDQPSIWDNILNKSIPHSNNMNATYNFVPSTMLPMRARLGTLSLTGTSYVLYPTTPDNDHLSGSNLPKLMTYVEAIKTPANYNLPATVVIKTTNNNEIFDKVLLHELFEDDYYVISKAFYDYLADNTKYEDLSYIELLISRFVTGKAIAPEDTAVAIETYKSWSLLHQFYLLPVLWVLATNN